MLTKIANFIKSLEKKDFREIIALMTITTIFLFMFAIVFVPLWKPMPVYARDFANIILGYLFGSTMKNINEYYFKPSDKTEKPKTDEKKID